MSQTRSGISAVLVLTVTAGIFGFSVPAFAVVGQAEQYDLFEQEKLSEFQNDLVNQDQKKQLEKADELRAQLKERSADLSKAEGDEMEELADNIDAMKKELLTLPKRDRIKFEMEGSYTFDSNANRAPLNHEDNDSTLTSTGRVLFDLSGRKTDLRWEVGAGKLWSIEYPEKDTFQAEEVLRYRRRYFKKIAQSTQSRIVRQSTKTVEINSEKIRYDATNSTAFNYTLTPRFSVNSDFGLTQRIFRQEAFDQDSSWEVTAAPSLFWNVTPKSRVSLGYKIGQNRIRTKTGNAVAHEIHAGYFGRITKKSSASLDLAFSHQSPRSADTAVVNTVTAGVGYIWQMTPKTQLLVQYINSIQNTTSKAVDTLDAAATDETTVTKTQTRFMNNSLSFSLNARLNRKLTAVLSFNPYYFTTHTSASEDTDSDSKQLGFPTSLNLTYNVKRWLVLTTGYTFLYRTGDEYADKSRAHTWKSSARLSF